MPKSPKRPCNHQGCPALTNDAYCEKHRKQTAREYNTNVRDQELHKFYNSKQWRDIRKEVLLRDLYTCITCGQRAEIVDHIVEIKDGGCRTCKDNLQSLCRACHNTKTKQEVQRRKGGGI